MSSLKKYRKVKYLGKGSYGAALLVELRSDPSQKFVIKEIVIGHLKPAEQQSAKNEAEVLHQMNHSNITMYVESFVENSKLYIVMEHADGGDLTGAIQQRKAENKYWQEEEVMRIFVQICLALKHVHNANILHRDLKSQNIFLTKKGMVKLGDFGIAKVLDASDDQARTQIGTPYYLSPEICESKPYGRQSDVWSLGVVLYELLALEMPFQATSLPALVHRICTAEPNYTKVETRYSQALITLCKSLLLKNPDGRPSLNQVVRTDFIKGHISKLLSYTLKSGTGGVLDGNVLASGIGPMGAIAVKEEEKYKDIDPDEVERNIEQFRNKERQQQQQQGNGNGNNGNNAANKQAQREEEREKLRKFRQDMVQNNNNNNKKRNENQSDGVASAMGQYRIMDAKESDSGRRSPPRSNISNNNNGRAISPKSPRRYNASPSSNPVVVTGSQRPAPLVNNNQYVRPSGQSSNSPTSQQSRMNNNNNNNYNQYRNGNGGYDNQSTKSTSSVSSYQSQNSNNSNDAARREFFANRAAALAVKAKVEAYERGGGGNGGGNSADIISNTSQSSAMVQVRSAPNANVGVGGRRPSDHDIDNNNIAFSRMDPETRIAMLKAQREKERDREIALKEMQIKQAIEANREERRKSIENRSKAIAFDINLNDNNISSHSKPTAAGGASRASRQQQPVAPSEHKISDDLQSTPPRHRGVGGIHQSSPVAVTTQQQQQQQQQPPVNESQLPAPRTKKGWGTPVDPQDILHARNQRQNNNTNVTTTTTTTDIEDIEAMNNMNMNPIDEKEIILGSEEVIRRIESKRNSQLERRSHAKEVLSKLREQRIRESRGNGIANGVNAANEKETNMKMRLMEVMNQVEIAKKSVSDAVATTNGNGNGGNNSERRPSYKADDSKSIPVSSSSKKVISNSNKGNINIIAESKRGEEILEVQQLDENHGNNSNNRRKNKMENIHEEVAAEGEEGNDDLEDTLAVWLLQQKQNITVRKKPTNRPKYEESSASSLSVMKKNKDYDDDVIQEDVNMGMYRTKGRKESKEDGNNNIVEEEFASPSYREDEDYDNRPLRGKYMGGDGDDVEVVGMQCMLAEALMSDDDDD